MSPHYSRTVVKPLLEVLLLSGHIRHMEWNVVVEADTWGKQG